MRHLLWHLRQLRTVGYRQQPCQAVGLHALSITLLATVASHSMWNYDRLAEEWEAQRAQVLRTNHDESLAATIELSLASQTFRKLSPSPSQTPHKHVASSIFHQLIPSSILHPTVVGLVTYYLTSRFHLPYKPLLVLGGVLVGWPAMFSLRVRCQGWRRARRAKALGAVPASECRGRSFGDIDVAREIQDMGKNGFIDKS